MRRRVRSRASEWKRLGSSDQVLGWNRREVRIPFIGGRRPHPSTAAPPCSTQHNNNSTYSWTPSFQDSCGRVLGSRDSATYRFPECFRSETGRKQMAALYRPTPLEQVLQGAQNNLRDTQAPQKPDARRRLDDYPSTSRTTTTH
jgi:hypothetical protein